jgi:hypothetical protein
VNFVIFPTHIVVLLALNAATGAIPQAPVDFVLFTNVALQLSERSHVLELNDIAVLSGNPVQFTYVEVFGKFDNAVLFCHIFRYP